MSVNGAPGSSDVFQNRSEAFVKWFETQDGARFSSKIKVADLRCQGAGRGVVATTDIDDDEELFAVPSSMVLCARNTELGRHLINDKKAGSAEEDTLGSWDILILVMIQEFLKREDSVWAPYNNVLPTSFDTLIFWSKEELAELQGSAVVNKIGKTEADDSIMSKIAPIIRSDPLSFPPPAGLASWDDAASRDRILALAHRAASLIMAYAFDLDKDDEEDDIDEDGFVTDDEDEPFKGMVPMADMLNADADKNNARLFQEDSCFIMKAIKPIKAGEELFNDYGPLPRSDLLRRYGYVNDNYAQYDVVEISLEMICNVAGHHSLESKSVTQQLASLDNLGLLDNGYIINRPLPGETLPDVIPTELIMLICTLCREADALSKRTANEALSITATGLLQAVITKRLAEYKTTITQDEEALASQMSRAGPGGILTDSGHQGRLLMAIKVRRGEKEILHKLQEMLAENIRQRTDELSAQSVKRKRGDVQDQTSKKSRAAI